MKDPLIYPIALTMINGVGNILGRNLLQYFGSAEAIFQEKRQHLEKVPGIGSHTAAEIKKAGVLLNAEKELLFIEKNKINCCFITDENYPYRLKECADAPLLLYSKGKYNLNTAKVVSVVGTRQATSYGKSILDKFIEEVACIYPELLVISGLAYGIDIHAHRAALRHKLPTIGVLAHGLDRIYPPNHRETAIQMLGNGGLLTDYPSLTNPDRQNFIMRNRIVAGLADATLVVESAEKGGSLVTADLAFSYSREVFAFPGRVNDPHSAGCNKLIKENKAGLITNVSDFLTAMEWQAGESRKSDIKQGTLFFEEEREEFSQILNLLKEGPLHINQLVIMLARPVQEISGLLFELEMDGKISTMPGQMYRIND